MFPPTIVAIPEKMLPNIVPLLNQHSINSETVPLGDSDDPERFLLLMRCSRGGAIVSLSVQRESHVNPVGPVVVCGVAQDSRSIALSEAITGVLTENGGWIPEQNAG